MRRRPRRWRCLTFRPSLCSRGLRYRLSVPAFRTATARGMGAGGPPACAGGPGFVGGVGAAPAGAARRERDRSLVRAAGTSRDWTCRPGARLANPGAPGDSALDGAARATGSSGAASGTGPAGPATSSSAIPAGALRGRGSAGFRVGTDPGTAVAVSAGVAATTVRTAPSDRTSFGGARHRAAARRRARRRAAGASRQSGGGLPPRPRRRRLPPAGLAQAGRLQLSGGRRR